MGDDAAEVPAGAANAVGAGPSQLVIEETAPGAQRENGIDDFVDQRQPVAALGDSISELVVVGERIDQGVEAADLIEDLAADGDRRAEGIGRLFDLAGNHHQRQEIGVDEQRLDQSRQAAAVDGSIRTGREADAGFLHGAAEAIEVGRADSDVAVGDHDQVVGGAPVHVDEVGYLAVGAIDPPVDHQLDVDVREIALQAAHDGSSRISFLGDATDDLQRRVALPAQGRQVFVQADIEPAQRLEYADPEARWAFDWRLLPPREELDGGIHAEEVAERRRGKADPENDLSHRKVSQYFLHLSPHL